MSIYFNMKAVLMSRLAKLHTDARCCLRDFRRTKEALHKTDEFAKTMQILTALGDEHRLAMVKLVQRYGELCACEIEAAFDLSHSTVIHHLNRLAEAGIFETRRDGKWSYYRLSKSFPFRLQEGTRGLGQSEPVRRCCCPQFGDHVQKTE